MAGGCGVLSIIGSTLLIASYLRFSARQWQMADRTSSVEDKVKALIGGYLRQVCFLAVADLLVGISWAISFGLSATTSPQDGWCVLQSWMLALSPLMSAAWTFVIGFELLSFTVNIHKEVEGTFRRSRYNWYHLAWVVPVALVVPVWLLQNRPRFTGTMCWFEDAAKDSCEPFFFLYVPKVIIIAFILVVYTMVSCRMCALESSASGSQSAHGASSTWSGSRPTWLHSLCLRACCCYHCCYAANGAHRASLKGSRRNGCQACMGSSPCRLAGFHLYPAVYIASTIFPLLLRFYCFSGWDGDPSLPSKSTMPDSPLAVLVAILGPSQGFLNFFVFVIGTVSIRRQVGKLLVMACPRCKGICSRRGCCCNCVCCWLFCPGSTGDDKPFMLRRGRRRGGDPRRTGHGEEPDGPASADASTAIRPAGGVSASANHGDEAGGADPASTPTWSAAGGGDVMLLAGSAGIQRDRREHLLGLSSPGMHSQRPTFGAGREAEGGGGIEDDDDDDYEDDDDLAWVLGDSAEATVGTGSSGRLSSLLVSQDQLDARALAQSYGLPASALKDRSGRSAGGFQPRRDRPGGARAAGGAVGAGGVGTGLIDDFGLREAERVPVAGASLGGGVRGHSMMHVGCPPLAAGAGPTQAAASGLASSGGGTMVQGGTGGLLRGTLRAADSGRAAQSSSARQLPAPATARSGTGTDWFDAEAGERPQLMRVQSDDVPSSAGVAAKEVQARQLAAATLRRHTAQGGAVPGRAEALSRGSASTTAIRRAPMLSAGPRTHTPGTDTTGANTSHARNGRCVPSGEGAGKQRPPRGLPDGNVGASKAGMVSTDSRTTLHTPDSFGTGIELRLGSGLQARATAPTRAVGAGIPIARSFSSSVVQVHLAAGSLYSPPGAQFHHLAPPMPPPTNPFAGHDASAAGQLRHAGLGRDASAAGPSRMISTTALSTAHECFADADVVGAYFQDDADYSFADHAGDGSGDGADLDTMLRRGSADSDVPFPDV